MTSRRLIVPAMLLVLLGAGGCATDSGTGDSAVTARAALYRLLDDTEAALGGTWDDQDDPTARGCVIPLWQEGELYPALRVGTAPHDTERAAALADRFWRDAGYTTTRAEIGDVVEVKGTSDVGEIVILRVSREAMTLQGESECRPAAG